MTNKRSPTVWDLYTNLHQRTGAAIESLEGLGSPEKGRYCQFPDFAIVVERLDHTSEKTGLGKVARYVSLKSEQGKTIRLIGIRSAIGMTAVPIILEGMRSPRSRFSLELLNADIVDLDTMIQARVERQKDKSLQDDLVHAVGSSQYIPNTPASRAAIPPADFDRLKTVAGLTIAKIVMVNSITETIASGGSVEPIIEELGYQLQPSPNGRGNIALPL